MGLGWQLLFFLSFPQGICFLSRPGARLNVVNYFSTCAMVFFSRAIASSTPFRKFSDSGAE